MESNDRSSVARGDLPWTGLPELPVQRPLAGQTGNRRTRGGGGIKTSRTEWGVQICQRKLFLTCDPLPPSRDALEGKAPQTRPQKRLGRRLEGVAKAVGGGYCRLQMPLELALAVRGTVAGHRLGVMEGGGGNLSPLPMHPWLAPSSTTQQKTRHTLTNPLCLTSSQCS